MVSKIFRRNFGSGKVVTVKNGTEMAAGSRVIVEIPEAEPSYAATVDTLHPIDSSMIVRRDDGQLRWVPRSWCRLAPPWE